MPIPWNESLLPEAAIAGIIAAVCAGMVGGFIGASLVGKSGALISREDGRRLESWDRRGALLAGITLMAVIGWALPLTTTGPDRAQVALKDIDSGSKPRCRRRSSSTRARAATNPDFINVTAWQGGEPRVLDPLEKVSEGVYRTTKPIPVYGGWKSTFRIQQGNSLISMPIFMPKDQAIPAPEVPAKASFTRAFLKDKKVLQREQKKGVPGFLTLVAYLTVLAIALAMIAMIAWALLRLDRGEARSPRSSRSGRKRAELV